MVSTREANTVRIVRLNTISACIRTAAVYEVSCRSREDKKEFPAFAANTTLRLIIRAVWRGDGNITSVPGASITLEVMYTS